MTPIENLINTKQVYTHHGFEPVMLEPGRDESLYWDKKYGTSLRKQRYDELGAGHTIIFHENS